jgi:hypothetical protein
MCLMGGRSVLLFQFTKKAMKLTVGSIIGYHCCQRHTKFFRISVCIHQILEKKWEYNETVHHIFIDFKKAYDSVRRELLYNILIGFRVPLKLIRLNRMCLNEMYNYICVDNHLSGSFPI